MLIDSHCHLYKEYYLNIDEIINKAKSNNVMKFISCADSLESCKEMHELSYKFDDVYYAIGIHPENSNTSYQEFENFFYYCLPNPKLLAIGEIGLDYHYENCNREEQIELFEKQLVLAEREKLPVIIHSRDATLDTLNILKKHHNYGVIHCFSGSLEIANEYIKLGYYIGVGGVVTFKNAKIADVVKELPMDKIILETDSPFLAPTPYRGEQNDPSHILDIANFVAQLKNISLSEVEEITTNNVNKLFFLNNL